MCARALPGRGGVAGRAGGGGGHASFWACPGRAANGRGGLGAGRLDAPPGCGPGPSPHCEFALRSGSNPLARAGWVGGMRALFKAAVARHPQRETRDHDCLDATIPAKPSNLSAANLSAAGVLTVGTQQRRPARREGRRARCKAAAADYGHQPVPLARRCSLDTTRRRRPPSRTRGPPPSPSARVRRPRRSSVDRREIRAGFHGVKSDGASDPVHFLS